MATVGMERRLRQPAATGMMEETMSRRRCPLPVLGLALALLALGERLAAAALQPERLRCEYLEQPFGIDDPHPRLSWRDGASDPAARALQQTAYRILVASRAELLAQEQGDLWDSGRMASGETLHIAYAGAPLASLQRCWWTVRVWDQDQQPSAWSAPAGWTMGMLAGSRWSAQWIGSDHATPIALAGTPAAGPDGSSFAQARWLWMPGEHGGSGAPAGTRWFARDIALPATPAIVRATLWLAGDDTFTATLNGSKALTGGGWKQTAVADVTALVHAGPNLLCIAAVNATPSPAGIIGTLEVRLADGSMQSFPTAGGWRAADAQPADATAALWPVAAEELGANGIAPWGTVALAQGEPRYLPTTYLRRPFTLDAKPVRALLIATALGHLDLHLNHERISDEVFAPGWSDYAKHVAYRVYDVTARLHAGENVLGAILGDGWFRGNISVLGRNRYGSRTRLRAELHLFASDGAERVIASDGSWSGAGGAIIQADMFAGETYDARLEPAGWDGPGFDAAGWLPVDLGAEVDPALRFYRCPPVRPLQELAAVAVTLRAPGVWVLDLGQNIAGWARLRVHEPAGTVITLRFAEMLNADGTLYTQALRSARATDTYVCRGGALEEWEPRFTYHGFRYIEVSGLSAAPGKDAITGVVVHSDLPLTSAFACSDPLLNQISGNARWGQLANYLDLPTDCPQRDERMGWTGDTQVFARTAAYHMEVGSFLSRWMDEMLDAQTADGRFPIMAPAPHPGWSPGWSDAGVIVPWTVHQVYGDTRLGERCLPAMQAHLAYYRSRCKDLIGPAEGFGDWLAVGSETPKDLIATAYFAHSARLVAELTAALGRRQEAADAATLADQVAAAFRTRFVHPDGAIGSGSQTGYLLALRFGLLTDAQRRTAGERLVQAIKDKDWHLSTGFLGVNLLLPTLSDIGRSDVAYRLVRTTSYPSWGYSVAQGATTMWERWNSYTREGGFGDVGMNSFNHYAYGACAEWLYRTVLGIDAAQPGFAVIDLRPEPGGGLTWAKGSYDSLRGSIASSWTIADGIFRWTVTIPPNTTAIAHLAAADPAQLREQGHALDQAPGVSAVHGEAGAVVLTLGSGTYQLSAPAPGR
jgi:alpha-L-rhamnosidase